MGQTLSRRQFAKLAGVSNVAVSAAVKRGALAVGEDDRLDPEHPQNAAYLERQKGRSGRQGKGGRRGESKSKRPSGVRARAPKPADERSNEPSAAQPEPESAYHPELVFGLQNQKDYEDIQLKRERRRLLVVQRAERLGLLVERSIVEQKLAALGAELNVRLLQLPRRISPQIVALVEAGKGGQVEQLLERELSDVIKRAKKAGQLAGG